MLYTTLTVGDQEYKLRATAAPIVELEKKLGGRNPLSLLMATSNGGIPALTDLLLILHAALQKYNHGMTFEKVLALYDDYVDSGKTYMDLIPVMLEVFKTSGFFNNQALPATTTSL